MTALTWVDRKGAPLASLGVPASHNALVLSPDERMVAAEIGEPGGQTANIWLIDVTTGIRSRFTSGPGNNWGPFWSPDGARIVFGTLRNGPSSLYQTVPSPVTVVLNWHAALRN